MGLPKEWHVKTFASADSCLNYLQQEPPRWERDYWIQQGLVNAWKQGDGRISLPALILDYWAKQTGRFDLTKVCVFDHLLPGTMTGLDALSELLDWPGHRVLITGDFDDALATTAFNRGVIDQYLTKRTADLRSSLVDAVDGLMRRPDPRANQTWATTLSMEQQEVLRDDTVATDLRAFAERTWSEWICIGEPFGILGQDLWGGVSWLQLAATSTLHEVAAVAVDHECSAKDVRDIREGKCLHDIEFQASLGRQQEEFSILPAFYIGANAGLIGALQRVHRTGEGGLQLLGYQE